MLDRLTLCCCQQSIKFLFSEILLMNYLNLIRLGFLKVVFSGGINLTPAPFPPLVLVNISRATNLILATRKCQKIRRNSLYLVNEQNDFNEIFRKDVTYDNFTRANTRASPQVRDQIDSLSRFRVKHILKITILFIWQQNVFLHIHQKFAYACIFSPKIKSILNGRPSKNDGTTSHLTVNIKNKRQEIFFLISLRKCKIVSARFFTSPIPSLLK